MTDKKIYADVKMVPIDEIKPSPFENANEFSEELYDSLKNDVEAYGLVGQALIVNPKDNTLVDGHHRLRVMQELGYEEVPVIFYEPKDEVEHKVLSIAWNRKRGTFNEQKLHSLIKSIHDSGRYSLEELAEKLGFNSSEIREKLEAIEIDENLINKLEMDAADQEKNLPALLSFSVSKEDLEIIEEALELASEKSRGKALTEVCRAFVSGEKKIHRILMAEIQKPTPKGQKTPEGIRKVTLNLKRESVLKSGGFAFLRSGLAPGCQSCIFTQECEYYSPEAKICRSMVEFESQLEAQIMCLPQIQEIDRILVKRLCRNYGFLYITDKWLSKASPFLFEDKQFDFQPILKTRAVYERLIIHFCSALGLTPDARSRIGLNVAQTYSLAKELSELEYDKD